MKNHAQRGRLLAVVAALLWSTSGLFVKSPPIESMDPAAAGPFVACYRALIAALVLAPLVKWRQIRLRRGLIPLVVSFASMNVLFVTAMTMTDAGDVIFLQYTAPFWVLIAGVPLLKERIVRANAIALALALVGVGVIAFGSVRAGSWAGAAMALGAGASYAGVILSLRFLRDEDGPWLVWLANLSSGLVLLPFVVRMDAHAGVAQWGVIAGLAIVQMGTPYIVFARSLRSITAQEAGLITLVEPVVNPIWVWVVWHQPIAGHTILGGGLILLALVLRYGLAGRSPRAQGDAASSSAVSTS